jgi:tRNA(Arg) A34 adenosine deaminase TadA
MNPDQQYLAQAVNLAAGSAEAGGFPSGALIVVAGAVIGEGLSCSRIAADPTAHAEVSAIRLAAAHQGADKLPGATLYTALEPCLMCLYSAFWAGIGRIVYGARKRQFKTAYYEGGRSLRTAAGALNRRILIEYLPGFEERIVALVNDWEKGAGA